MPYLSLYRKYRSQSFGEVMGQQHITTVLQNAIRMGRIAHAYLFCGPRGCGKTSSARLLARALNCLNADGPTPEPCGVCSLCERIRNGSSLDVIEMDAASETGIDDVREKIIENAKFAPAEARFKVYIIDEVHDLSAKAFDSLLKTIEEPPAHVVFILATTEAHKVPVTVRSRCQRMDFRRGSLQDLVQNLRRVLESEKIDYEPEAVTAIARAAEGSFRDSLSLLEQALAYTEGGLTAASVHASIGTVGAELLDSIVETIASDDLGAAFVKAGELVETGKDVKQTLIALQLHLRDLVVASTAQSPQALPEVSPERFHQLKEQARRFQPQQLLQMLDVLADIERDLRFTNQHRLLLERAFWSILPTALRTSASGPSASSASAVSPSRPAAVEPRAVKPPPAPVAAPPRSEIELPPQPLTQPAGLESHDTADAREDASRFAPEVDVEAVRRLWPRVIRRLVSAWSSANAIFSKGAEVVGLDGRFVQVGFADDFQREKADRPKARAALEHALATELGLQGLKVKCVLLPGEASPATAPLQTARPAGDLLDSAMADPAPAVADMALLDLHAPADHSGSTTQAAKGNGTSRPEEAPTPSPSLADEHAAFVEIVKKELDCLPLED